MEFKSEENHFTKEKLISFSYSNSPSPSSSSSLQNPHPQMTTSWLSTKYEPQPVDLLTSGLNPVNDEEDEESGGRRGEEPPPPPGEKEHMFDKVVTPSDVGKLNRLVIPKQHAERYFPLDSTSNEKGPLLDFEDRTGKSWRFRYSYWNSSQSYVMTKGWSRFVKDKKLDAGDIISFQRGMGDSVKDRFFIDWRRRPDSAPDIHRNHFQQHHYLPSIPWSPLLMRPPAVYGNGGRFSAYGFNCANSGAFVYMRPAAQPVVQWPQLGGGAAEPMVYDSVPVVQGKAAAKRLRLFGVNMDCPIPADSDQCENQLSSSSSLQLKLYNGTPMQSPSQILHKGKSSMSFDLDI